MIFALYNEPSDWGGRRGGADGKYTGPSVKRLDASI